MAEIIDEEQEKEFKVRMKSKRHIRAILIIINLLLIGYFAYYISDAVVDYFQKKDDNFVTFNDMSKAKSKKLYQRLIADEEESYQNFYNILNYILKLFIFLLFFNIKIYLKRHLNNR